MAINTSHPQLGSGNYGYLLILGSAGDSGTQRINFPSLPDEIPMSREAQFEDTTNIVFPDGISLYQRTTPLEIPMSFSLHYSDDYCVEGAQSLLDVAARLQATVLPVTRPQLTNSSTSTTSGNSSAQSSTNNAGSVNNGSFSAFANNVKASGLSYPPACLLRLILSGSEGFGVSCIGYVKSVKTTPKGPWMQVEGITGSNGPLNLPTSCDYEFVFVHSPGYTNRVGVFNTVAQAYGPDVYQALYNTQYLSDPSALNNNLTGANFGYDEIASVGQSRQIVTSN